MERVFDGKLERIYDGQKETKLGTEKHPARVQVQTKKRQQEVAAIFKKHGWECEIKVEPDQPEDITELDLLLNKPDPVIAEEKPGRNEPCPCGSGKKYKKCCGSK